MGVKQPQRPDGKIVTTMRLPQAVREMADARASEENMTRTHYVVTLIERDAKRRRVRKDDRQNIDTTNSADIFG